MDFHESTTRSGEQFSSATRVVLVTGAAGFFGSRLVERLARNPAVRRVVAVDDRVPDRRLLRRLGSAEFIRADIRNPMIRNVIGDNRVDTVVHAGLISSPPRIGGRALMKDINVLGTMQLFAACQKAAGVRRVVLRSSSAVYGGAAKDPAKFTEEMSAWDRPKSAFANDVTAAERYIRGLARRRPDITTTTLRLSPLIGPELESTVSRYLGLPIVPCILGRDARVQLLHEQDALAALERAVVSESSGIFNIAGDGIIMLSQAIRSAGRVPAPMPMPLFRTVGLRLMNPVMREFSGEQLDYFQFGCVLDTTRMRQVLGFEPRWTTRQAFDDFIRGVGPVPVVDPEWVTAVETRLLDLLGARS